MSYNAKKSAIHQFSEEDKTKELPPPSKIKQMLAKGELKKEVGENVLKLQSAHEDLKKDLDQAKAQLNQNKQNNESTVVFNLRQLEANGKVEELEDKKNQIEKEINNLMNLKNSKVHDDLQKVVRFLVQEMKRIAPLLETTINDGVKNNEATQKNVIELTELKKLIGQLYEDQKKSLDQSFEEKIKLKEEIATLELSHHLINDKHKHDSEQYAVISQEYQKVRAEYSNLLSQKLEIEQELSKLVGFGREEVTKLQSEKINLEEVVSKIKVELHEFDLKKQAKDSQEVEFEKKLKPLKEELHRLYDQVAEVTGQLNNKKSELTYLEKQYSQKEEDLFSFKRQEKDLERKIHTLKKELEHVQSEMISTEERYNHFTNLIQQIESDYLSKNKELEWKLMQFEKDVSEKIKHQEMDVSQALKEKEDWFKLKISEYEKTIADKEKSCSSLVFEYEEQYRQKTLWFEKELISQKNRYTEMLNGVEVNYKTKVEFFEKEFEQLKFNSEYQLKLKEDKVNQELKDRIQSTEQGIGLYLDQNKTDLVNDLADVIFVKGQYNLLPREKAPDFDVIKKEMNAVLGAHLHKSALTRNVYRVHRTLLYAWAISSSLIATGLVIFNFFIKK